MNRLVKIALKPLLRPARFAWRRAPKAVLQTPLMHKLGSFVYDEFVRDTDRIQSHVTLFMRNLVLLEVLRDLLSRSVRGATIRIASIGCSTGAELYSALWVIRSARPDLRVIALGIDISDTVVEIAQRGTYRPNELLSESGFYSDGVRKIFETHPDAFDGIMETTQDGNLRVKDWLRAGVRWEVGDATDPGLLGLLGPQDVVMVCNVLGPMEDALAERCLRNIVRLVAPDGYLVVDGIDLDLKTRVVQSLHLRPITIRIDEVHMADPTKRDWPWTRWGLEPLDRSRPDWAERYSSIYLVPSASEPPQHAA